LLRNLQWRQQLYAASKGQTLTKSSTQDSTRSGFPLPPVPLADEQDEGATEEDDVERGRPIGGAKNPPPVTPRGGFVRGSANLMATVFLTATRIFLWLPSKGLQAVSSVARASGVVTVAYTASHLAMGVLGIKDPNQSESSPFNGRTSADRLPPGEGETDDEARQRLLKTHHRRKSVSYSRTPSTLPDLTQSASSTPLKPFSALVDSFQLVLTIWTAIGLFTVLFIYGLARSFSSVWKEEIYIPQGRGIIHSGLTHRHVKQPQWGA